MDYFFGLLFAGVAIMFCALIVQSCNECVEYITPLDAGSVYTCRNGGEISIENEYIFCKCNE